MVTDAVTPAPSEAELGNRAHLLVARLRAAHGASHRIARHADAEGVWRQDTAKAQAFRRDARADLWIVWGATPAEGSLHFTTRGRTLAEAIDNLAAFVEETWPQAEGAE